MPDELAVSSENPVTFNIPPVVYSRRAARGLQRSLGELCGRDPERDKQEKHGRAGEMSLRCLFFLSKKYISGTSSHTLCSEQSQSSCYSKY